ncbi:unnamed protein product [Closterium sp. NIES-53]
MHVLTSSCSAERIQAFVHPLGRIEDTSVPGAHLESPVVLTGHADASWADDQATQRSSQGYTFSLGSGSVSWRSTRSSFVLGSCCEAEIYARAMAAQELRWLTYLLADLGEPPRSPPVLYVDNKAMLALCREHRLEHRTKHIAHRYFLAHELQQRGQLRLAYVASEANTADIFTKALPPGDHQRFCTMLACFALLDWSYDLLFSPTLPMGRYLTSCVALLCLSRRPALPVALPCWVSRCPDLPVASPCWMSRRPALPLASPCWPSRRPAARASHCWQPRRPSLPAHRPALPALSHPAARTALLRDALLLAPPCCCPPCCSQPCWPTPCCLRAALLANALLPARRPAGSHTAICIALPAQPCCCPPCCAPPYWPPPCPALAARHSSLAVCRLSLPCAAT